jgi:flagellin-like protein
MNRHFNNRAVSQIIAALLLIAIAVAAAILLYVFSIGLLGSLGTGGGQQTKEQLIMEAYSWTGIPSLSVTVRNVGPANIGIGTADVFVNGVELSTTGGGCADTGGAVTALTPQGSCVMTLDATAADTASHLANGAAYPMKIVTPEGGVFSYSIILGGSS